jgi:hypothetical protein
MKSTAGEGEESALPRLVGSNATDSLSPWSFVCAFDPLCFIYHMGKVYKLVLLSSSLFVLEGANST